jgi:hypothetical protein
MNKALVVLGVALVAAACRDNPVTSPAAERAVIATQRQQLVLPVTDNGDGTSTLTYQPGPGLNNGSDQGTINAGQDMFLQTPLTGGPSPWLMHFNSDCNSRYAYSLYRFDVTDLPEAAIVTSVRLELYHFLFKNSISPWPAPTTSFSLFLALTPWNEQASWATQPMLGPEIAAVTVPTDALVPLPPPSGMSVAFQGWGAMDITPSYIAWKNGDLPNYGVAYRRMTPSCDVGSATNWTYTAGSSMRDNDPGSLPRSTTWRPKLVVTYVSNHTPTVAIIPPFSAPVGAPVTFVTNAADEDGDVLTYAWTIDGIAAGTTPTITHAFADAGTHVVSVTVSDGKVRGSASMTMPYTVLTQAQWVDWMRTMLNAAGLEKGLTNSLGKKLDNAVKSLEKGNTNAASGQLGAFTNEIDAALKTGRIPAALGNQLLAMANQLLATL